MKLLARAFLGVVGLEYIALGLLGLAALHLGSDRLLGYCAYATWFLLVAPMSIVDENGIQAECYGKPIVAWGCGLGPEVINEARFILFILCLLSLVGGLAGIWGACAEETSAGRLVWRVLTCISIVVALWNVEYVFEAQANPFIGVASILWAVLYAFASLYVFRENDSMRGGPDQICGGVEQT